jgi:methylenetetrahydrofolate dehydrogenase (NADP+)/methenyltetrahydrofolate cyclohydrolase
VLVGDNSGSQSYVGMKKKACAECGIASFDYTFPEGIGREKLLSLIAELNQQPNVHGILVQLPLPKGLDENEVINSITPDKDVDGFHPVNVGKIVIGDDSGFLPCTPYGCVVLINSVIPEPKGKHVVVVGRSNIVGKPLANMLMQKHKNTNCIVTVCHSAAPDVTQYTRQADILVAAVGIPGFITADMVKEGVVVIDVGMNRVIAGEKSVNVGDVDFVQVEKKAFAITPVPKGVGPMTIAMLLTNTVKAFKMLNKLR